jgi:hypothetical protein
MYRRGFSIGSLRSQAQSYYYRIQRMRNPRAWLAGIGCTVLALIAVCCLVAAIALYLFLPISRSAIEPLLALV